jgi:hypothetical protein
MPDDAAPQQAPPLTYARATLDATPARVVTFVRAIATTPAIRSAMAKHGYGRREHDEAWQLLRASCAFEDLEGPEPDRAAHDAVVELDAWVERGFLLVRATLQHKYPAQAAILLSGLEATVGPAAAAGIRELLDRLDDLEQHGAPTTQRRDDAAALALLSARGLSKAERERLRKLVDVAESAEAGPRSRADDLQPLRRLRGWFDEWTAIARATVQRPDHLARLGLAGSRRAPDGADERG